MKKFLALLLMLMTMPMFAQNGTPVYGNEADSKLVVPIAGLPSGNVKIGATAFVTDASTTSTCTSGGGANKHSCIFDGAGWVLDGSSGGSGAFAAGLGTSYQDVTETATPANPSAGNDRLYLNSTTHQFACLTSAGASCLPSAGAASWSALTAPSGNLSLSMTTNTTVFTWGNTLATNPLTYTFGAISGATATDQFTVQDTTGSTTTGSLLAVKTIGTSTAKPFTATAQGAANGVQMSSTGLLAAIGTGGINATQCSGAACGTVTSVTGTAPIVSSNGTTPAISVTSHGATARVQLSDNTGTSGNIAKFAANGDITDGGILASNVASLAGATFTGKVTTLASATGTAGFNIPAGVAPTSPVIGDVWLNGANLFFRDNTGTPVTRELFNFTDVLLAAQFPTLAGDVTTPGASLTTTVVAAHGNTIPAGVAANQVMIANAANTFVFKTVPDCVGSSNALNYTQSTFTFSCLSIATLSNPMTTLGDIIVGGTAGAVTRMAGATTLDGVPQFYQSQSSGGVATAPTLSPAGVPVDTQSGTPYTVLLTDRTTLLNTTNNTTSTAVTVPQAGSTNFANNFAFVHCNSGSVVATDTPTTSTINGNATLVLQGKVAGGSPECAFVWSDNANYFSAVILPTDANGRLQAAGHPALSGDITSAAGTINAVTVTKINNTLFAGTNGNLVSFGAANIPTDSGVVAANVATSASGTTGFIPKYTAARVLGNSLADDGITTANSFTYTGVGGLRSPLFTATGSTAGAFQCTAGTSNGHATASTITLECPAAVTAYGLIMPGAAATGLLHWTNASSVVTESISAVVDADISGTVSSTHGGFGAALNAAATGLYPKSNGGTPAVFNASTLAAAGVGSCTNQPVIALNGDAAPTCNVGANTGLVVQGGIDATTQGSGGTLLAKGEDVTGGSTVTLTGGAATLRGGDNASTGNTSIGGAVTVRGGDSTGGTGTSDAGGIATLRGGNCTSTTGGCAPGASSFTSGGFTAAFTNGAAADNTIAAGLGTGNAAVSHVKIQSPALSQTSGSTAQTQVTRYVTHVKAGSTTSATPTNMFNVALANNQTAGVLVFVHVETTQATPHNCSTNGLFFFVAQDTGGTVTQQTQAVAATPATICDTGTLTLAAAASAAAPTVFSVTPTWATIVPTAVTITIEILNASQQDIALL